MRVMVDDRLELSCISLKVGGWEVEYAERKVAGLNGTGIKSLGRKKRIIKMVVRLREMSRGQLKVRRDELLAMADGEVHILRSDVEGVFDDMIFDECEVGDVVVGGGGASCEIKVRLLQVM